MADFSIAYEVVSRAEGGYQRISNDPGNYNSLGQLVGTNWGISAPIYEQYLGAPPTEAQMRSMSSATARNIYRNVFWGNIQGDSIRDQNIANILFDGHVNQGFNGIRFIQDVLGVGVDGVVGPITLNAINTANGRDLFYRYKARRIQGYHDLVARRPSMREPWLRVWLNRMNEFEYNPNFPLPPMNPQAPGAMTAGSLIMGGIALWFLMSKSLQK